MGNLMRIAELEGQVERKDAYIDKLELKLDEVTKDRDERAELSARLFSENEQLKHQLNLKQLEIDHCHAVCAELRQKLDVREAEVLDREADLILAAPDSGVNWSANARKLFIEIGTMMKSRAALARAKVGTGG